MKVTVLTIPLFKREELDAWFTRNMLIAMNPETARFGPEGWKHLRVGDRCVITGGEQQGWTGVVNFIESLPSGPVIQVAMDRRSATTGPGWYSPGVVTHRARFVSPISERPPEFDSPEQAEAWMATQAPIPVGAEVIVHWAERIPRGSVSHFDGDVLRLPDWYDLPGKVVGYDKDGKYVVFVFDGDEVREMRVDPELVKQK